MTLIDRVHQSHVASRRVRVLHRHFHELIPPDGSVLDVGCGDGELTAAIAGSRPDLAMTGVEVLVRDTCQVNVLPFDGRKLPFDDQAFDWVMFVDVLHHTADPLVLLREAARVARRGLILKDHTQEGFAAQSTLRFMDRVGNARHGVALPYNYWTMNQWSDAFAKLSLDVDLWRPQLGLYWWPASLIFERRLHFVARLVASGAAAEARQSADQ